MLRVKDLHGYHIHATDGDIGSVEELYFDDERWTVRYLIVDTGTWLAGRRVLISPISVTSVDRDSRKVNVNLTQEQVKNSPDISLDMPVSRQEEARYYNYYGWPFYWGGIGVWGPWAYPGAMVEPMGAIVPGDEDARQEPKGDRHLRSTTEVTGYHIEASDGEIGHVSDFVVDEQTWEIRYLVVDTSNWWFGRKILVSAHWVEDVDWGTAKVFLPLAREQIRTAPEWNKDQPITREYEDRLHQHYGHRAYWA